MSGKYSTSVVLPAASRLTILRKERRPDAKGKLWWQFYCRCQCGAEKWIPVYPVAKGVVLSCGCLAREQTRRRTTTHGMTRTRLHHIWRGIRSRCRDENRPEYGDYGGRGIRVCDEWEDFACFYAFVVSLLPDGETDIPKHLTIERKDTNGHYEPGNVTLATRTQQNRNTRRNRLITVDGVTKCMAQWAEEKGLRYQLVNTRIYQGWDPVLAVTTPSLRSKRRQ
jgi:hypothetical protein